MLRMINKSMWHGWPIALAIIWAVTLFPAHADRVQMIDVEPLVHVSFDDGADDIADSALTNGIVGKGLIIGEAPSLVRTFPQPLSLSQGSIVLWFCPIDWDDVSYVELLKMMGSSDGRSSIRLRLYVVSHHWRGLTVLQYLASGSRVSFYCNRSYVDHWKADPTQWRHIAFTWDASGGLLYVDGLETSRDRQIGQAMEPFHALRIGAPTVQHLASGESVRTDCRTVLDEIRLYDTVLTPEQIRADYESLMGSLVEADNF